MEKLIKNVAIAHSGIYTYTRGEVPTLGLNLIDMPQQYQDMEHFNVYRPGSVIAKAAPLYARQPVTVEHPDYAVTAQNAKELMNGLTGDTAEAVYRDGEVYIDSTLTLVAEDAIKYYEAGYNQVSPGYTSKSKWMNKEGNYKGMPYQIVVTDISGVNHLALCQRARGGPTTRVLDSQGGSMAKFKSGLLYSLLKAMTGTKDSVSVREELTGITKDGVTEEQIVLTVDSVLAKTAALPESEGREKLTRFLEDLKLAKSLEPSIVTDAVAKTAELYEALDSAAEEDASVKDYAVGTTGAAGAGSQKMIPDGESGEHESAEMAILKQILAAVTKTTTDAEAVEKAKKEADEKATKDALDAAAAAAAAEAEKIAKDAEEEEKKKKSTTDSITATLTSGQAAPEGIAGFMSGFGK